LYFREGTIAEQKHYINALRYRLPEDSMEKLAENKQIPAVIAAREEYPDVDLVLPWSAPYQMSRTEHTY